LFKECWQRFLKLIYPNLCVVCNEPGDFVCHLCEPHIRDYSDNRALFVFNEAVKKIIHAFKYYNQFWVRRFIKNYISRLDFHDTNLVIPVPLHNSRLKKRGFNQSVLLAELLAKEKGLSLDKFVLKRIKNTVSQTGFSRKERNKNLKNAFQVSKKGKIEGRNILLVDDVRTTGTTLNEAKKTLLRAGARSVRTLSVAIVV